MMGDNTGPAFILAVLLGPVWLVMPILSAGAHWVWWRQVASRISGNQIRAERSRRFILLSTCCHVAPLTVVALGIGTAITPTILDYLRPWDADVWVWVFHATLLTSWGVGLYWVLFRDGATVLADMPDVLGLTAGAALIATQIKIMTAIIAVFVGATFVWMTWSGWFAEVSDVLHELAER